MHVNGHLFEHTYIPINAYAYINRHIYAYICPHVCSFIYSQALNTNTHRNAKKHVYTDILTYTDTHS